MRFGVLFVAAVWGVGLFWGVSAVAAGPSCGFLGCEEYIAQYSLSYAQCVSPDEAHGSGYVEVMGKAGEPKYHVTHFRSCNCSAFPSDPPSSQFANSNGHYCKAGCTYHATGPSVCWNRSLADPSQGKVCMSDGGWNPDGSQCNPVQHPSDPPDDPPAEPPPGDPPPPTCSGDKCLQPMTGPPPNPPKLCTSSSEGDRGCAPLPGPSCGSGPGGYTCVGNPPPAPPDPIQPPPPPPPAVAPPPLVNPPPDFQPENVCVIAGADCTPVGVDSGGPPVTSNGGAGCPAGQHDSGGACVDDQVCWNGRPPIGGRCAAPPGQCPDGTSPVGGVCNAGNLGPPDDGGCPPGSVEQNGMCYGVCPNGENPVNGQCDAMPGRCPNGQSPVNGECPIGTCDPVVDPDQCGQSENHAGGGETCEAPPFCSGDEALCGVLRQSWETRCAVARLSPDGSPSPSDYGPSFTAADAWEPEGDNEPPVLDGNGWLGGNGTCPDMPSVSFMGESIDLQGVLPCDALRVLSLLILLGGYVQAGFILGRA